MQLLGVVSVPAGKTRNNLNTGASILDCATKGDASLDTVIRATSGGVAGDDITIALTAGAPAGVTISKVALAFTIHYRTGVSTVADVEAAIAALSTAAAPALIAVDVPGTGATVLTSPGASFTAAHLAGGAAGAFAVPASVRAIYITAPAASCTYCTENFVATTSLLRATASNFALSSGISFGESLPYFGVTPRLSVNGADIPPNATAVAVYNGSGGDVLVPVEWTGSN